MGSFPQKIVEKAGPTMWLFVVAGGGILFIVVAICCRKKKQAPKFDIEAPPVRAAPAPPRPERRKDKSRLNFPSKLMNNVRQRSRDSRYSAQPRRSVGDLTMAGPSVYDEVSE